MQAGLEAGNQNGPAVVGRLRLQALGGLLKNYLPIDYLPNEPDENPFSMSQ